MGQCVHGGIAIKRSMPAVSHVMFDMADTLGMGRTDTYMGSIALKRSMPAVSHMFNMTDTLERPPRSTSFGKNEHPMVGLTPLSKLLLTYRDTKHVLPVCVRACVRTCVRERARVRVSRSHDQSVSVNAIAAA
jgi:hypothetical protein